MQENVEGGEETTRTIGELTADGKWHGASLLQEGNHFWVQKASSSAVIDPLDISVRAKINREGDIKELRLVKGGQETQVWIKYLKGGNIAFKDPELIRSHPDSKMILTLEDLKNDYEVILSEYKTFKKPENQLHLMVEKAKMRKPHSSLYELNSHHFICLKYADGIREYFGEVNITTKEEIIDESKGLSEEIETISLLGRGCIRYGDFGFIYFLENEDGLPVDFSFEKSNELHGVGYYSDGFLNGRAIVFDDFAVKYGIFEDNSFLSGRMTILGEGGEFWIESTNFEDDKPNGQCTIRYDDGTQYEGNMVKGNRHGRGTVYFLDEGISIESEFYSDNVCKEPVVRFRNGVELSLLKNLEEEEELFFGRVDNIKSAKDILEFERMRIQVEGSVFEGQCLNFKPHGFGEYTSQYGYKIEGSWKEGQEDGHCRIYSEKFEFEGSIEGDKISSGTAIFDLETYFMITLGEGSIDPNSVLAITLRSGDFESIKKAINQDILDPKTFRSKVMELFGSEINIDDESQLISKGLGLFYVGDMERTPGSRVEWYFEGKGKSLDALGAFYEGEFQQGKYHGYGRLIEKNGFVKEGKFEGGKFLGGDDSDNNNNGKNNYSQNNDNQNSENSSEQINRMSYHQTLYFNHQNMNFRLFQTMQMSTIIRSNMIWRKRLQQRMINNGIGKLIKFGKIVKF